MITLRNSCSANDFWCNRSGYPGHIHACIIQTPADDSRLFLNYYMTTLNISENTEVLSKQALPLIRGQELRTSQQGRLPRDCPDNEGLSHDRAWGLHPGCGDQEIQDDERQQ